MKQSKDPFEAAFEEQEESPPDSPVEPNDVETLTPVASSALKQELSTQQDVASTSAASAASASMGVPNKNKEEDEDEEEENMDVELKLPSSDDPGKMENMNAILSQFTEEQMSRYEAFRRSVFKKPNMKRLLVSITGSHKISVQVTIAVSVFAKMFVCELVETVITERNESGPIRPCHIREAHRRLKIEGKVPRRSVSRLFRHLLFRLITLVHSSDTIYLMDTTGGS